MGRRLFLFVLFAIACLMIVQRENFKQIQTVYKPAPTPSDDNSQTISDPLNYYRTGKYDISLAPVPKFTLENPSSAIDLLSRKKINGFLFVQYNLYKLQINFVDLGYGSLVQINYWTHDVGSLKIQEKVGFSLEQDFNEANLNLDIIKQNFKLLVRQTQRIGRNGQSETVTNFNISALQHQTEINANYTHIRRDDQCATIVRNGVISHKCFGGYGYGKVRLNYVFWDQKDSQFKKKMSAFNPKSNQTRCAFDGFRGSGWDWKWMWMYATGFSKPYFYANDHTVEKEKWIGFNFGTLHGKSEDFLFLDGRIYPLEGVAFEISDKLQVGKNITITAKKPEIHVNFEIMHKTVIHDDMGVLKNDMVKGEGHWAGYLVDPEDPSNKVQFYEMAGLVQISNSFF